MTLEEKIANEMGDQMSREIDREILWGMLKELGWTRVNISPQVDKDHSEEIVYWLRMNIHNPYEKFRECFIFENKKDASHFILRWA